jgi:MFS family permease
VTSSTPGSTLRRDLRASLIDGCAFCVMVGAGEAYFAAFALELGIDKVTAGLVVSVPLLLGGALQLVSPWAVRRLRSNSRWVVLSSVLQTAAFLPLVAAALAGKLPTLALFGIVAVYFGAGLAAGPAWTTWIETLVPRRITSRYFAGRSLWCQFALLTAITAAGWTLELGESTGRRRIAFAAIFAVAFVARATSTRSLLVQSEPVPQPEGLRHATMTELLRDPAHRPARRLFVFLLATWSAIHVAQPFLTSYLRGQLHLPYALFAAMLAIPYAARMAAMPFLANLAERSGARRVMWVAALLFVPAAALLALPPSVPAIAVAQAVAGVAFGAFELANLLLWFERIPPRDRTSVLTTYQFWYATSVVLGSAIGSVLLVELGEGRSAFAAVFLVSAAARLAAAALLLRI